MTQLAAAVDAAEHLWELDSLPMTEYVKVDDEIVRVRARFESSVYSLTGEVTPPRIRVDRGMNGTAAASHSEATELEPLYIPGSTGSETVFRSERVTFDMAGLGSVDNPPVPGIRLGDYVVPAGSFVLATVHVPTKFDTTPSGAPLTLYPLLRNTDGLTATALVDAPVIPGSPGAATDEGITSSVDPENSVITTEEAHLGAGLRVEFPTIGALNGVVDDEVTELPVTALAEGLVAPFLIKAEGHDEIMNVTAILTGPDRFTVQRAQEGTVAEEYAGNENLVLAELPDMAVGEAYIVFWITPLSGDLP